MEILIQATLWMNLEDIMLSDMSQSQGNKRHVFTYMRSSTVDQHIYRE